MSEQLGAMLVRLRQRKRYTQLRLAEALCAASGVTTVTRNEVSRWERQERLPSVVWLRWLAVVLEVPVQELAAAAVVTRKQTAAAASARASASPTAAQSQAGAKVPRPSDGARNTAAPASAPRTRGEGDPLSRVTLEFAHQTTCVRLYATYDDPGRAVSAISAFQSLVGDSELTGLQPSTRGGAAQAPHVVPLSPRRRSRPASATLTASGSAEVPMGIRYTSGPGVARLAVQHRESGTSPVPEPPRHPAAR
jgi:transcriptional regulator with XRE-family HTH domain